MNETTLNEASTAVQNFLQSMEARDLDRAKTFLAPGFTMEFPGSQTFTSLDDLVHWSGERYRAVRKHYDCFDALADDGAIIVYCWGTLSGEWLDGVPFSDIRFIDRFVVRDSRFESQKVWNDIADVQRPSQLND
ncbi:MAG: hypothetical protein AB8B96_01740 [Lysobacterales bacterium]